MNRSYEIDFAVDRLRVLLFKNNISKKKLAEILGCSYWTASKKYRGEAAYNLHDMYKLYKYLNIPNDKLIYYFCELPTVGNDSEEEKQYNQAETEKPVTVNIDGMVATSTEKNENESEN